MQLRYQPRQLFAKMIECFHSDAYKLVLFTPQIEVFTAKAADVSHVVIKDSKGLAVAHVSGERIYMQEEN